MKHSDNDKIKRLFDNLNVPTSDEMDRSVLDDAFAALEEPLQEKSLIIEQSIWRKIMRNRITKFATVAAIIIVVFIMMNQFGDSIDIVKPAYAISDVPKVIRQAKTMRIKMWMKIALEGERFIGSPEIDNWIDLQSGRSRTSVLMMSNWKGKYIGKPSISVLNGQYEMEINPNRKTVKYKKLSEFQSRMYARKEIGRFLNMLSLSPEALNECTRTGQEEIDGVNCDTWEKLSYRLIAEDKYYSKSILWVSADSGKLKKQQLWKKDKYTDGKWKLSSECEIYLDVVCPDDIFKTEPPEGYTEKNSKETAPTPLLTGTRIFRAKKEQGCIPITLALHEGTVIMAWHLNDIGPGTDQAEQIRTLKAGADLPENLRSIIGILVPEDKKDKTSYISRHLGYTQKDGRFYEWVMYIPNKEMQPKIVQRYMAVTHWSGNGPDEISRRSVEALGVEEDEFDLWVNGAMQELSNIDNAGSRITYEDIVRFKAQI